MNKQKYERRKAKEEEELKYEHQFVLPKFDCIAFGFGSKFFVHAESSLSMYDSRCNWIPPWSIKESSETIFFVDVVVVEDGGKK